MEKRKIIISVIVVILLAVALVALFSHKNVSGDVVANTNSKVNSNTNQKTNYSNPEWLTENCDCIEHNITGCGNSSFTYYNGFCRDGNILTYPIHKCSMYNCSGDKVGVKG